MIRIYSAAHGHRMRDIALVFYIIEDGELVGHALLHARQNQAFYRTHNDIRVHRRGRLLARVAN